MTDYIGDIDWAADIICSRSTTDSEYNFLCQFRSLVVSLVENAFVFVTASAPDDAMMPACIEKLFFVIVVVYF